MMYEKYMVTMSNNAKGMRQREQMGRKEQWKGENEGG